LSTLRLVGTAAKPELHSVGDEAGPEDAASGPRRFWTDDLAAQC
jgi:hypothetical protein